MEARREHAEKACKGGHADAQVHASETAYVQMLAEAIACEETCRDCPEAGIVRGAPFQPAEAEQGNKVGAQDVGELAKF
eukprot:1157302-Pelagomonas_calceolata.AAC.27